MREPLKKTAVCPGSYDPPTVGHTDVIRRAAAIFAEVKVLICVNSAKKGLFAPDERAALVKDALSDCDNVTVEVYEGLLMRYIAENDVNAIVKGIRNTKDFTYENEMAEANRLLIEDMCGKKCDTVFMLSKPENGHVSSTIVRVLLSYNAPIERYVDNAELLLRMYKSKMSK